MRCYRLCEPRFRSLDGAGALKFGGRWNPPGSAMVYAASSRALAALELLVHFDREDAPGNLLLLSIDLPDSAPRTRLTPDALPADWQARTAPDSCRRIGSRWLARRESLALEIPSVIVPEEFNVLLNPNHTAFSSVTVIAERPFRYDARLLRGTAR